MKQIAKTEYYELGYDEKKNQIYWKIKGFWPSVDAVPNFDSDWEKATVGIPKGFTILGDLTEMKTFPPDVAKLNQSKQKELMELGCRKVAQVNTDALAVMQINRVARGSGMSSIIRAFDNAEEAKAWLDKD